MKSIIGYLRDYLRREFHWGAYLVTATFLGIAIWYNYSQDFVGREIYPLRGEWRQWAWGLAFFGLPYAFILLVECGLKRDWQSLRRAGAWAAILFAMGLLSFSVFFPWHRDLARHLFDTPLQSYGDSLFWNLKRVPTLLLPLLVYRLTADRERGGFYGWELRRTDLRPYFLMLLIVLPGIVWASFQPDFLRVYPSFVPGRMEAASGWPAWLLSLVHELVYGLDYALVELFFRGFLVIGLARWLGPRVILPMVTVYCFLHFGKPAGEAISSVFGGYILGVIALYSRSIWGGIVVHMGLAWLMDLAAAVQLWAR